jgi:chaperonin GroEL (HSP60 family)
LTAQTPLISTNLGRLRGESAWNQNLGLAVISATKIESCLGPAGAMKVVTYNRGPERVTKVTKDAVEILRELEVQYPAVKTIAEAARLHREQKGDGVSTFVIILARLLQGAQRLKKMQLHPTAILRGYRSAAIEALAVIEEASVPGSASDERIIAAVDCGRRVVHGPLLRALADAARTARARGTIDKDTIRIVTEERGSLSDSSLHRGFLVKKERAHPGMPDRLVDARVAFVSKKLDIRQLETHMKGTGPFNMKLELSREGMERLRLAEGEMRRVIAKKIASTGAGVILCRSKIPPAVADELSKLGVMAFELVDEDDFEAGAIATGATPVGDIDDIRTSDLGFSRTVEITKIGGLDHLGIETDGCSTLLVKAGSKQELEEAGRVVSSAITVLRGAQSDGRVVPGGGAIQMRMAIRLRRFALDFPSKEQLAISAFADALESVPASLATNFGLDRATALTELRAQHANGHHGIGVTAHGCAHTEEVGVEDLASISRSTIQRAYEVASLLLRVDDYFYVKELPLVHKT